VKIIGEIFWGFQTKEAFYRKWLRIRKGNLEGEIRILVSKEPPQIPQNLFNSSKRKFLNCPRIIPGITGEE